MAKRTKVAKRQPAVYEPKQNLSIDLAQDISDHASELLWGQGFIAKYEGTKLANKRLQEILKLNRADELFPYLEKQLSLYGNIFMTIDIVGGEPTWTLADPQLNSQSRGPLPSYMDGTMYGIGRAFNTDVIAVIWKRITHGTISFNIKEIWDKDQVKRQFFGENNKLVKMAEVNKQLPEELQVQEFWYHKMGFIPVIWHKNLPAFNTPSWADTYKGNAPQQLVNKTLSELWHETETNRTRIIGNMDESTYNQIKKNGQLDEVNKNDFLVNINFKNSTGSADNVLIPILADPKFDAYWSSIHNAKDEAYQLAGYSPLGDGSTEKTATENLLMKTGDYQTTKKKRNLRIDEITKLINMTLAVDDKWGFGAIYGTIDDNITFQIMENKVMDSLQEITNLSMMVEKDFMSKAEAIAQIRGVDIEDAKDIYTNILQEKADEVAAKAALGIEEESSESQPTDEK